MRSIVVIASVCVLVSAGCSPSSGSAETAAVAARPAASSGHATVVGRAPAGSLVALEPLFALEDPPPPQLLVMDQSGQMFIPGLLAGSAGQDVEFRSSEDILHNVRVDYGAGEPIFNVATPPWGKYVHKLDRPGFYNVSCDIHTTMRATIFLADAPYVTAVPDTGEFVFQNVRHGAYRVSGYIQGNPIDKKLEVTGAETNIQLP